MDNVLLERWILEVGNMMIDFYDYVVLELVWQNNVVACKY